MFCGACACIAPKHFFVDPSEEVAKVTNQPQSAEELAACRAAMINCPTSAIRELPLTESLDTHESAVG
jgi:ferredoxin